MEHVSANPRWKGRSGQLCMLVRREWWEHASLRILPLSLLALVLAASLLALVAASSSIWKSLPAMPTWSTC